MAVIDNYSPQENVDNDDGSSYYNTHHNFFVYVRPPCGPRDCNYGQS